MRHFVLAALAVAAVVTPAHGKSGMSDAQIKQAIIKQSIANYPGNCPCPYNSASNGSSCGKRSAWSRGGGYAPMCYADDINKSEVEAYRARH